MKPIQTINGPAAILDRANVDTDQIIPARFMSRARAEGYGSQCFYDLRFNQDGKPRSDWQLNTLTEGPVVLVTDENFGCGSSREAAVYALMDFGIEVLIAPSFGDIFRTNAGKNGLLPIVLPKHSVQEIKDILRSAPGTEISVDLPSQRLCAGEMDTTFEIDTRLKYRLECGLDELSATLQQENRIAAFEEEHLVSSTWRIPTKNKEGQKGPP